MGAAASAKKELHEDTTAEKVVGPQLARSRLIIVDESIRGTGPIVALQRHGRTSKNAVLKVQKNEIKARLQQLQDGGSKLEDADCSRSFQEYRERVSEARWFDDVLDAVGVEQAAAAGAALGKWAKEHDVSPDLLLVSPFRRALQTQDLGMRAAAFAHKEAVAIIAKDELGETPYDEASCRRHPTSELGRWFPHVDVTELAENAETTKFTQLEADFKFHHPQSDVHPIMDKRAADLTEWLRARPGNLRFTWITTHQGTAKALLHSLFGHEDRGYNAALENAQIVLFRLPVQAAGT